MSKAVTSSNKDKQIVHQASKAKEQPGSQKKVSKVNDSGNKDVPQNDNKLPPVQYETNLNTQQTKQAQVLEPTKNSLIGEISPSLLSDEDQQQMQQDQQQDDIDIELVENNQPQLEQDSKIQEDEQQQQLLEIVDTKYGDQKIDLSGLQQQSQNVSQNISGVRDDVDPSRPLDIPKTSDPNEPLPSYSNRVNIGEFSVGNYKEFQLREDLANLIEKYNKQFYGDAKKPIIRDESRAVDKETRYKEKVILNPIAVPNPAQAEGNYSWMYLMTPYYNQLVSEFKTQELENNILQQHFEYYMEMEKEKELLNQEFEMLKLAEQRLQEQMDNEQVQNRNLEDKVNYLERNVNEIHPERFKDLGIKLDNLSGTLKAKDNIIDQLLNEISLVKNEKDDVQNEVLFKKQRIENLNLEYNSKELEYQRLWEEEQNLKAEVRGETTQAKDVERENEALTREIAMMRDEVNQNQSVYEEYQQSIYEKRAVLQDLESRLRYANDVIQQLESENQQVELDIAQSRAAVEGNNRAYNEMRNHFYMLSNRGENDGSLQMSVSSPIISIPKVVMPSTYLRPSAVQKSTINLMPSPSKAMSQQVGPSNIKNYLSVKKTTIDLTSDLRSSVISRDQKVRFSMDGSQPLGGMSNLPARQSNFTQKRSDSMDQRVERRNFNSLLENDNTFQSPQPSRRQSQNQVQTQVVNPRANSVNRNFIDSMGGILGMSEEKLQLVNLRASVQSSNTFPLKKLEASPPKSIMKDYSMQETPDRKNFLTRTLDTDDYYQRETQATYEDTHRMSTMSTQTPFKNKVTMRGGPGNRNSQPMQKRQSTQKAVQQESPDYRGATWQDRMSQLPRNSAYKSSIAFGEDGVYSKEEGKKKEQPDYQTSTTYSQPFQMARDYDIDISGLNEDDPQAKAQIVKFKQQKIYELSDHRKLLQSQASHIPEHSKSIAQRQKRQELESEVQMLSKRISMLKYDVKKLTCKDDFNLKQEMASQGISSQLKAKMQLISSPKIKNNHEGFEQSPKTLGISKIQFQKVLQRDGHNKSQSPEDQNASRGLLQRIQMKNLAFIPAKSSVTQGQCLQSCNITNMNHHDSQNTSLQSQQTKVSPSRMVPTTMTGGKVVIPANQIKLVKKDNASPSPESRQPQIKQLSPTSITFINHGSNIQNANPNIITNGGVSALISKNSALQKTQKKISCSQLSDDETNVNSDNEEPKLSTATNVFTDQTLAQQRTQRGSALQNSNGNESSRVKVISHNKIRHSPSPPHNQPSKTNQAPNVSNVNVQMQAKPQQQQSQTQLASDFIKGMINQSRQTNNILSQNTSQKKVLGGLSNCIKKPQQPVNFAKDMKKHGIAKDVQEVNQLGQLLSENSPLRQEESSLPNGPQNPQKLKIKKIQHLRNYSPPPNFEQPTILTNIQGLVVKESKLLQKKPQETSPTNASTQNDEQTTQKTEGDQQSVFQFPFQRRARSLSLTKQEQIQSKMGQRTNLQPGQDDKSQSPPRPLETQETKRNKPVVANVNFVIPHHGKPKEEDDNVFERNKEVDEWLMGSGQSDATATSKNSIIPQIQNQLAQRKQQSELEKPVQPSNQNEGDCVDDEDMDDWMFKTFDKVKNGKKDKKPAAQPSRINDRHLESHRGAGFNFEEEMEEESPFDIAPEMQKQFSKPSKDSCGFLLDNIVSDCNDLSQYIDKIDQFMMDSIL